MGTSDGHVVGTTKVVDHGTASQRWNIVIMGDGYRASDLSKYEQDVDDVIDTFYNTPPFDELWCGINIYRVDVVSNESGADDPAGGDCGGTGATAATYFDATFCGNGQIHRLLTVNSATALNVANAQVPQNHVVLVIVNSSDYGGSGGAVATFSTHPSAAEIALHELGHAAFGLADEYPYYAGCGSGETDHDNYTGAEPSEPNVTIDTNRATNKWRDLIAATTAMPTTSNANCNQCDTQASPVPAGTVGTFEGGRYFHCGIYRPEFNCEMRSLGQPFCAVCRRTIRNTINPFLAPQSITLLTPSIAFIDIPEGIGGTGVTTHRAIVFEVVTCTSLTFTITSGPTGGFGTPLGTTEVVSPAKFTQTAQGRLWLSYTSANATDTASGTVTVQCVETGQTWTINIVANTVARPKSAVALVLDRSYSMTENAGDGTTKEQKLREAANIFLNVMLDGDGLGIVSYNHAAQILMNVTNVGPTGGTGRTAASGHINGPGLNPSGSTSIGDGVLKGKQILDAATETPPYAVKAMVVLTDGKENTSPRLSSVGGSITANTFAIGLGKPENISTAALNTLTQGHNGYLLVTGTLTSDQSTRLSKYFLQILAGITNADVVLDPSGRLAVGTEHRIPFSLSEADMGADIILLSPLPQYVQFALETPDGDVITPSDTLGLSSAEFVIAPSVSYYRISLPTLPGNASGSHAGTWHVILRVGAPKDDVLYDLQSQGEFATVALTHMTHIPDSIRRTQSLPYDLIVHTYSNLRFDAQAEQESYVPGTRVSLYAWLKEYDAPVEARASVWADITRPDGSRFTITLDEMDSGQFAGIFQTTISGLYTCRVRASGTTLYDSPFSREKTVTLAVYRGADGGVDDLIGWLTERDRRMCELLHCLLHGRVIGAKLLEELQKAGVDLHALRKCLARYCSAAASSSAETSGQQTRRPGCKAVAA